MFDWVVGVEIKSNIYKKMYYGNGSTTIPRKTNQQKSISKQFLIYKKKKRLTRKKFKIKSDLPENLARNL